MDLRVRIKLGYRAPAPALVPPHPFLRVETDALLEDLVDVTGELEHVEAPLGSRSEGGEAIKPAFKQMVAALDRRFDARAVAIVEGPVDRNGNVWFRWVATYTLAGAPPLRMHGEETAVFVTDRIQQLEDRISAADGQQVLAYLAQHGSKLRPQRRRAGCAESPEFGLCLDTSWPGPSKRPRAMWTATAAHSLTPVPERTTS